MVLWIAVAGPLGYELGIALGNLLTGYEQRALGLVATNPRAAAIILVVTLIASTGFTLWLFARARLAESETRAESAQRVATENQLKLLESQLEPHMLFNTLANLRVLIGIDPPRAQAMLAESDRLRLSVRDTGVGMVPAIGTAATSGTRFGLAQVRERLATVYGPRATFSIAPAGDAEGGTVAEITLPLIPREPAAHEQEKK